MHILGKDMVVRVAVKNDNDYIAEPSLIPQRKEGGKKVTLKHFLQLLKGSKHF
ncbi:MULTISPECIES: hypothetical protein [Bacillus]|uniref:hypothetical protein n=1 Tax=Bacillus TaxID=1386 RepID=UPI000A65E1E3|nr:hypothetical protein [Bacillus altitudinis]